MSTDHEHAQELIRAQETLNAAVQAARICGMTKAEMLALVETANTEAEGMFADIIAEAEARAATFTGRPALQVVRPGEHPAYSDSSGWGQRAA